jgi:hypothetical protein
VVAPVPHDVTWGVGDTIVLQEVWHDRVWAARPLRVVEDGEDRLVLWCPKGAMRIVPTTPSTRERADSRAERIGRLMQLDDWVFTEHEWDVDTLWFVWPGAWHAVWVSWFEPGVHWGWYGNLQLPYERTRIGLRTMDMMLDVLVEPDHSWKLKDEDDFQQMIDRGLIDDATIEHVRAAAREVVRMSEAGDAPFCDPWPSWTPDPSWPTPVLPDDWDSLS